MINDQRLIRVVLCVIFLSGNVWACTSDCDCDIGNICGACGSGGCSSPQDGCYAAGDCLNTCHKAPSCSGCQTILGDNNTCCSGCSQGGNCVNEALCAQCYPDGTSCIATTNCCNGCNQQIGPNGWGYFCGTAGCQGNCACADSLCQNEFCDDGCGNQCPGVLTCNGNSSTTTTNSTTTMLPPSSCNPSTICGYTYSEEFQTDAISGIPIELRNLTGGLIQTTRTDDAGFYSFPATGKYLVNAVADRTMHTVPLSMVLTDGERGDFLIGNVDATIEIHGAQGSFVQVSHEYIDSPLPLPFTSSSRAISSVIEANGKTSTRIPPGNSLKLTCWIFRNESWSKTNSIDVAPAHPQRQVVASCPFL